MKICSACKIAKDESCFAKNKTKSDGLQSACKDCQNTRNKRTYAQSQDRRDKIAKSREATVSANLKLMRRYKRMCGCKVCHEREPVALDLHHVDPQGKDKNPSQMISYSSAKLKAEIRKCIVLCANCHRKVHAGLIVA